jgi:hypothetical protein
MNKIIIMAVVLMSVLSCTKVYDGKNIDPNSPVDVGGWQKEG